MSSVVTGSTKNRFQKNALLGFSVLINSPLTVGMFCAVLSKAGGDPDFLGVHASTIRVPVQDFVGFIQIYRVLYRL